MVLLADHVMAHHLPSPGRIMTAESHTYQCQDWKYNGVTATSKMTRAADKLSLAGLVTVLPYKGSPLHTCY